VKLSPKHSAVRNQKVRRADSTPVSARARATRPPPAAAHRRARRR
jgi:hypothetical protein